MKKIILILGIVITTVTSYTQTTKQSFSFSVKQAIDYAMQNVKDVKNAEIDEMLAKKRVAEIRATGLPQINSSFDLKDFVEIPTSLIPAEFFGGPPGSYAPVKFGTQYQATAGLDATQMIFNADYFLGIKGSKVFIELSTKNIQRTRIEAAAVVSKAYYTVLVNTERSKLMDANVARIKKTMEDTKVLLDNGFVEKLDYDRLAVIYTNLTVEQEKIQRLLSVGTYLLKYQMGMDVNADLTLTDKLEDVTFTPTTAVLPEKFDYSKRIEYGIFETQFLLSKLDVKRQKLAYLPYAFAYGSLSGSAMRKDFDIFETGKPWYPTGIIGAKITLPIFSGGQRYYRTQQAKLRQQQSENNLEFIKKTIDLDLAASAAMLTNASSSLENQKNNIKIAEEVVNVTKKKYNAGVGSNMEVITAETALKEAQTNYLSALYDAIIAKIDFDKANGNLK